MFSARYNSIITNEKGEISFIGFALVLFILSLSFLVTLEKLKILKDLKFKTRKHLCFKYLHTQTKTYIKQISHSNKVIKGAYLLSLVPVTRAQGKALMQVTQGSQFFFNVLYLKKLFSFKYCQMTDPLAYIKKYPYKRINPLLLKRSYDGTTILKKKKWELIFQVNRFLKQKESITVSYQGKSSLSVPKISISYQTKMDFNIYKQFYGPQ